MKRRLLFIIGIPIICLSLYYGYSEAFANSNGVHSVAQNRINVINKLSTSSPQANTVFDKPIDIEGNPYNIAEDDKYVYYCSKEGICKLDKSNGKISVLLKHSGTFFDMTLSGKYLYLVERTSDDNDKIFRIDTNGKNYLNLFDRKKQIHNGLVYGINELLVKGNTIYMKCTDTVYSYNIESKKLKLIVNDAEMFNVIDEYIYYIDHGERTFTIYKKSLATMKTTIVLGEGRSYPKKNMYFDFTFVGNNMYFATSEPNGVYNYNNGNPKAITNKDVKPIESLTEHNGNLYYLERIDDTSERLMLFNPKSNSTSQVAVIKGYSGSRLKIINGYIYYNTDSGIGSLKIK